MRHYATGTTAGMDTTHIDEQADGEHLVYGLNCGIDELRDGLAEIESRQHPIIDEGRRVRGKLLPRLNLRHDARVHIQQLLHGIFDVADDAHANLADRASDVAGHLRHASKHVLRDGTLVRKPEVEQKLALHNVEMGPKGVHRQPSNVVQVLSAQHTRAAVSANHTHTRDLMTEDATHQFNTATKQPETAT